MSKFDKLGLKKEILAILHSLHYDEPFEVQKELIPLIMRGKNVVFTSKTGSGKTLAYLLGFVGKINKKHGTQMMVLVPTRELCIQVGKELKKICRPLDLTVGTLYGGTLVKEDYRTTSKKIQILVGTPGRLLVHINEKKLTIGEVRYLVYDESDQMFDAGFYDDCAYMRKRVSKLAQIICASATITNQVHDFMENEIVDYDLVRVGEIIPSSIVQEKLFCDKTKKNKILLKMLSDRKFKRAIIFCNTKLKTADIAEFLEQRNISARPLHSDLEQVDRLKHLRQFKNGDIQILVATDVAARGLHIEDVDIVVNYDVPTKKEFYIHRIGRTGRINSKGYALTLICPEDEDRFYNIEFEYELKVKQIKK